MSETMNMMEINIQTFTRIIREKIEDEDYDPVMGIGKAGVGKTMCITELCKELGIGYAELRLVTMSEIDMLGIPTVENGRTTYAANKMLPSAERDGAQGILVLDEITSCSSTLRAAAYQLLDSKRALGEYKLPDNWLVVCLGNGADDGGVFSGMENAMVSRCTAYRVAPDFEVWKKWAINNGVNKSVIAFLSQDDGKNMHVMKEDEIASVFPCPRSWVALSKKLNAREAKKGGPLDSASVELYAAGAIGVDLASAFATFYKFNEKLIDADTIINGTADPSIISTLEPETQFLLCEGLVSKTRVFMGAGKVTDSDYSDEALKKLANLINFALSAKKYRADFTMQLINSLNNLKEFADVIVYNTDFMDYCPGLLEYLQDSNITIGLSDI